MCLYYTPIARVLTFLLAYIQPSVSVAGSSLYIRSARMLEIFQRGEHSNGRIRHGTHSLPAGDSDLALRLAELSGNLCQCSSAAARHRPTAGFAGAGWRGMDRGGNDGVFAAACAGGDPGHP